MNFIYNINYRHLLLFLLIASISALLGAYISQYVFDLQPCILCFYQRKPFFAVIILTILALLFKSLANRQKLIIILAALILLINAFIALYHVGVENKIFAGPANCSAANYSITDIDKLKQILEKTKAVRCDKPAFTFLNISMAGWNVIYCLSLVIITFITLKIINNHDHNS